MTKIIYGFSGEGSGHSSRARELARSLLDAGHDVKLCSYDRGYQNLKADFDVQEIEGLTIGSQDNQVSVVKTFTENFRRLPAAGKKAIALRDLFRAFRPHCVISDFEPLTAYFAHHYGLPLITVDNQHRMRYLDYEIPESWQAEAAKTKLIIRMMIPSPDVCLVTSLIPGATTNDRTMVFPPMVAREVRSLASTDGEHLLVYVTSGFESLIEQLTTFPRERFLVYGSETKRKAANVEYRKPSRESFLTDLASASGVIATAGFTLISEALFLRKPYLAFPMRGQFEQELNGFQLAASGLGKCHQEPSHDAIAAFLYDLPELRSKLNTLPLTPDNSAITERLLELVADEATEAKRFRQQRKGSLQSNQSDVP